MSVDLPLGRWFVRLQTDSDVITIKRKGARSVACWEVSHSRMREQRPMILLLSDQEGGDPRMMLEVSPKYPGQRFVEGTLKVIYQILRPGIRN